MTMLITISKIMVIMIIKVMTFLLKKTLTWKVKIRQQVVRASPVLTQK